MIARKYFFWAIIAILIILSYLMLKPYLVYIISSFILAYLAKPLYDYIEKRIGKVSAGLICVFLVALIVLVPTIIVIAGITEQAANLLNRENLQELVAKLSSLPYLDNINVEDLIQRLVGILVSLLTQAISHLPTLALGILITFFGMYYTLTNWDYLRSKLRDYIPVDEKDKTINDISKATNGIIYGTLIIGVIQFTIAAVTFYLIGVKYYLVLSTIIFFTALIPGVGPGAVWVPMVIYYFITNRYFMAGAILFVGLVLISILSDNILRAKILQKTSKINPFIMLVGIIGGVSVFGIFGFIIGPLVLVYTIELLESILEK